MPRFFHFYGKTQNLLSFVDNLSSYLIYESLFI